jgi:hypothetical protein
MSGYSVLIPDAELTIYTCIYIIFHILDKKRVPPRPVYLKCDDKKRKEKL